MSSCMDQQIRPIAVFQITPGKAKEKLPAAETRGVDQPKQPQPSRLHPNKRKDKPTLLKMVSGQWSARLTRWCVAFSGGDERGEIPWKPHVALLPLSLPLAKQPQEQVIDGLRNPPARPRREWSISSAIRIPYLHGCGDLGVDLWPANTQFSPQLTT